MSIEITSNGFREGQTIPQKYTDDGDDKSPPLSWKNLPEGTKQLALVVDDPDAPRPEPFVHWVVYNIPADAAGITEGIKPSSTAGLPLGAVQGTNSLNKISYKGPAPPRGHGVHHYHFTLYALDEPLELEPGLDKDELLGAMAGHVLDQGDLIGTYQR